MNGRMNWSSEFACTSIRCGTICGTVALNAGPKKASPVPKTIASRKRCQSSSTPVSDSTAMTATASARTRSVAIMIRRRSTRSLITPPTSRNAAIGRVHATPISESAVGVSESS